MRFVTRTLVALALVAMLAPAAAARTSPLKGTPLPKLLEKAKKEGVVDVIIGLRTEEPFVPEGELTKEKRNRQRDSIKRAQLRVAKKHARLKREQPTMLESIPHMLATLDAETLQQLAEDDDVVRIDEERVGTILMAGSAAHVNAPVVWSAGHTGSGWAVAQLDTGVEKSHPMLSGKVAAEDEACFGRNTATITATCPNNDPTVSRVEKFGEGAAAPCTGNVGCAHGTQTAAIAVGQNGFAGNATLHGIARGASLVPINVFSLHNDGTTTKLTSHEGDHLRALQFIERRVDAGRQIASVNISINLITGLGQEACDAHNTSYYQLVANLRSKGVLVVAGTGNGRDGGTTGFPACLSNALAVGATRRTSDEVASYSYVDAMLDLWAPGGEYDNGEAGTCATPTVLCLTTATTGGGYVASVGTSFAAPHVAGAVAVLRGRAPTATVDRLVEVLTTTGPPISHARTPVPRRRLDLAAAVAAIAPALPAPSVTATATNTTNVAVTWTAAPSGSGITHYRVQRRGSVAGGWTYLPGTFTGTSMNDTTVSPATAYEYRVEAYDAYSNTSPFSAGDVAVTVLFDDDPVSVPNAPRLVDRGRHLAQLREAIDAWRVLAGLGRLWGPPYDNPTSVILFSHIDELTGSAPPRGFDEARQLLGRPLFVYSEGAPQQGGVIRASHVQDLRNALK